MTGHAFLRRSGRLRQNRSQPDIEPSIPADTSEIVALQRLVGNQGVQRMLADGQLNPPPRLAQFRIARQETTEEAVTSEAEHQTLSMGAAGDEVVLLQRRLNLYGAKLVEDGIWGNLTQAAVIAFQHAHGLAADAIVGPLTWNELEKDPPAADFSTTSVDPLNPNRTGAGIFQNFVNQEMLSQTVAIILDDMQALPGFGAEMARFAHQALSNGSLVGFVRGSESGKVKSKLQSQHHALVDEDVKELAKSNRNGVTRGVVGEPRSYILFKDSQLDNAAVNQPVRDVVVVEFAHELTHHRSRADFDRQASLEEAPTARGAKAFFVDVKRAKKFPNTQYVRAGFIDEIVSRHVAFCVENDRKPPEQQITLTTGQLFKAALELGGRFTPYNDNGYMQDLAANALEQFRQQIGEWLGDAAQRSYHGDPAENARIQALMQGEFDAAAAAGFAEPPVSAAGLSL